MNRREFMVKSLEGALAGMMISPWPGIGLVPEGAQAGRIESLFESSNPDLLRLAEDVFRQCVLAKIRPPEGTLEHRWLQAGTGDDFYGQWIWDTMFEVDLLAILPEKKELIREIFQNYWDFQERWNNKRPEYAHNMIACMIEPKNTQTWNDYPAYSQIPILGWGLERVFQRNEDKGLVRQSLGPLEKFHEWYWNERDVTDVGLVAVGSYSGKIQHARFETFDYECNLDDLKLTAHPLRKGSGEGRWYGDICLPGITSYLIRSERSLVRLAKAMGDHAMAERRQKRIRKSVEAVRKYMWDEASGTFLAVRRDTLEKIQVATIGSWMPLMAEIPTPLMVERMAETFVTDHWQTPLPIPTVDRKDRRWVSNSYWRGDVWPATNYQVAFGFAQNGHPRIAADIADKTVANALTNGINEHYDSISGRPLGVPYNGMTCTIVTMMLDGLTNRYKLKARKTTETPLEENSRSILLPGSDTAGQSAPAASYVGHEAAQPIRNVRTKESAMKKTRTLALAALIVFGSALSPLSGSSAADARKEDPLAARIDALLAKAYPADKPGAVSLVVKDGKVLFQKAYGLADLEFGIPMTPKTVFACGSMTKMFTATAVMMLAEARSLRYDDPISKYLPEAPSAWAGITVDHVLSHTSGLLDLFKIPEWMAQWKEEISPEALIAFFKDKPLQFEPGTKAEYSNSNYAVLGQIVEHVSGKPLEQFVNERIIRPLDLKSTRFAIGLEEIVPLRAKPYLIYPDGSLKHPPFMIPWSQAYGAGTVHSTVGDIAKFVAALFDGTLLKPESLVHVTTPRTMKDGTPSPYGYGNLFVFVEGTAPMIRISGSTIGTEVYLLYLKDEKALVAVFSNVATYLPRAGNPYFPGPLVKEIALMLVEKR